MDTETRNKHVDEIIGSVNLLRSEMSAINPVELKISSGTLQLISDNN